MHKTKEKKTTKISTSITTRKNLNFLQKKKNKKKLKLYPIGGL